jgi:serine/threonine protein kinase
MASLEKAAYDALAATPEEKALAAQSRQAWLTSKLVDFSLTPPEWLEYKSVNGHNTDLASFESFYREAESRDTAMAQNLLSFLNNQPRSDSHLTPIALLVTGGFHAKGMADLLTKSGATVISYVPKIEKIDANQGSAYLSVFTQEKTPLEKLFEGQKLFLANPPVNSFDVQVSVPGLVAVADGGETFGSVKEAFLALISSKLAQKTKKIAETKSKETTRLEVVFEKGWSYTVESTPGSPLEKDRFMMKIKKQSMNPLKLIPEQLFVLPAAMTATVIAVVTQTPFLFPVAAVAGLVVLVYFRNPFIAFHPRANADILKVPLAKYQNTIGFGFLFFGGLTIFGLIMALAGQSFLDLPTVAGIVFQHVFVYGTAYHVVFNLFSRIPAMSGLGSTNLNQDQAQAVRKALLQNYHLESIDETSFVARGAYSSVFKVTSKKGQFAAIVRNDSPDSLRFEEQIRSKASARGALVSSFVTAKGGEIAVPIGENTWLTLTPFASGTPGRWGQVGEGSLKAAMEALAKFHDSFNNSLDVEKGLIDPSRFNQIPVIQFGDLDRVVRRLDEIGSISLRGPPDPQKNTLQALLIQNTAFFKEEIGRLQSDLQEIFNLPHSVVHGDFTPPNVLFNPDGSVNNIVDFGYSDVAPRVQDLGNFMVESGGRLDWDKFIQAVLAYDRASQTPLSSEELRLLPHMLRRLYLQVLWFQAELLVEVRAHDWRNVESLFQDKLVSLKSLEDLPWDQLTSALARKRLTNMAQPFVDFLSEADQMDGRPDLFVVSGSNDLKTYVEFARTWKKLGSNIPVVVAGGRGSGTIGLIRKCLVSCGERLTADQKELLEESLDSASLTTERDILLKVVFPQEGIPDSDREWFHEETRPSSNTEANMRNVAETVKSVLADKPNPSIALVNTPILLLRQSLNATQIWNNEDQRNWRILRYPTYTPILAEMDDNDLFETLFRLVGSPDPSQWDSTFKGELNGVRPGARAIPDSVKIDFSHWENVIDQTLPFFKAYVEERGAVWDPILRLLVVPNPELEKTTGLATSLWMTKIFEWLGYLWGGENAAVRRGAHYKAHAPFYEWSLGIAVAVVNLGGTSGIFALVLGLLVGALFMASHFMPDSMKPMTQVNVGVGKVIVVGVLYGVLIAATPFLLGAVPFVEPPNMGVEALTALWGLAGALHYSFDRGNPRQAGERAAWELVARMSRVSGAFETLMPVVQELTGQIVGKGRSAIDPVTITLSQLKTDPDFRAGFVHGIQMAVKQQKLSGTPLNLVSSLVKAATGESIVCMHVLGNSARTELEYIEQLLLRPKESADRFKLVLVVSELQRKGEWREWINYLENRGVSVFTVPLVAESWTRDNLVRLDRDMSSLLVNANYVVATMGTGVGISRTDVETLDRKSKLRVALENAVTLGEVVQTFLRILQALAANA